MDIADMTPDLPFPFIFQCIDYIVMGLLAHRILP